MEKTKVDFHITKIFGYIINLNYQIKKNRYNSSEINHYEIMNKIDKH